MASVRTKTSKRQASVKRDARKRGAAPVVDPRQLPLPLGIAKQNGRDDEETKSPSPNPLVPMPQSAFALVEEGKAKPPRGLVAVMEMGVETWVFDLAPAPENLGPALPIALSLGTMAWPFTKGDTATLAKADADPSWKPSIVPGMATDDMREFFLHGVDVAGVLSLKRRADGWTATLGKTSLPFVLSKEAVESGAMPPKGKSGLPPSLERVVPRKLRYWEREGAEAEALRNALVQTNMFDDRLVKVVGGELRLCVERLYLYEPDDGELDKSEFPLPSEHAEEPAYAFACETCDASVTKGLKVLAGDKVERRFSCDACAKRLEKTAGIVVLKEETVEAALASAMESVVGKTVEATGLDGEKFRGVVVAEAEGNLVVDVAVEGGTKVRVTVARDRAALIKSDTPIPRGTRITLRGPAALDAESDDGARLIKAIASRTLRVLTKKAETEGEERIVYGIVLEPETVDAQQDVYSPAEIRAAAHLFMQQYRTVGLMHKGGINDKVKILECFISPADFEVDGQPVKAGTWVMAVKVLDDELWAACKAGDITGFSIGGTALRKPDDGEGESTKPQETAAPAAAA